MTEDYNRVLVERYQRGDLTALDELYKQNLGFLKIKAKQYTELYGSDLPTKDLMQEGAIGLIEAAKRCDLNYDNKFLTYASFHIIQKMIAANNQQGYTIRIPDEVRRILNKITKLKDKYDYLPKQEQYEVIAKEINYPVWRLEEFDKLLILTNCEELTEEIAETYGVSDFSNNTLNSTLHDILEKCLGEITEKERDVLKRRFGYYANSDPETLEDVAKHYKCTRERIRQIESKALRKLRIRVKRYQLKDFMEG